MRSFVSSIMLYYNLCFISWGLNSVTSWQAHYRPSHKTSRLQMLQDDRPRNEKFRVISPREIGGLFQKSPSTDSPKNQFDTESVVVSLTRNESSIPVVEITAPMQEVSYANKNTTSTTVDIKDSKLDKAVIPSFVVAADNRDMWNLSMNANDWYGFDFRVVSRVDSLPLEYTTPAPAAEPPSSNRGNTLSSIYSRVTEDPLSKPLKDDFLTNSLISFLTIAENASTDRASPTNIFSYKPRNLVIEAKAKLKTRYGIVREMQKRQRTAEVRRSRRNNEETKLRDKNSRDYDPDYDFYESLDRGGGKGSGSGSSNGAATAFAEPGRDGESAVLRKPTVRKEVQRRGRISAQAIDRPSVTIAELMQLEELGSSGAFSREDDDRKNSKRRKKPAQSDINDLQSSSSSPENRNQNNQAADNNNNNNMLQEASQQLSGAINNVGDNLNKLVTSMSPMSDEAKSTAALSGDNWLEEAEKQLQQQATERRNLLQRRKKSSSSSSSSTSGGALWAKWSNDWRFWVATIAGTGLVVAFINAYQETGGFIGMGQGPEIVL